MRDLATSRSACSHTWRVAFLSLVILAGLYSVTMAVTIADFQFTGSSAASADPSIYWSTDNMTAGANLSPLNITTVGNPSPGIENTYGDLDSDTAAVSLSDSIAVGNYYSFTVTPDDSAFLDLTQLSFDLFSSGSSPVTAHLLSSVGGFTTGAVIGTHTATSLPSTFTTAMIDVSSLVDLVDPIEFRIYLTRPGVGNLSNTIRVDNIFLTGNATFVPEPSTFLLLGLGAIGLVRPTRRRRRRSEGTMLRSGPSPGQPSAVQREPK